MKYKRFEDFPVWQTAVEVGRRVYSLTKDGFFSQPGDLRDQLRRAALSISNNIAEGFERGSTAELLGFLYIARGSAGEVRSMLIFTEGIPESGHFETQILEIKALAESCSRQIRGWTKDLQNSDIGGPRHLNEQSRGQYQARQRSEAFEKQLDEIMRKARTQDYPAAEE